MERNNCTKLGTLIMKILMLRGAKELKGKKKKSDARIKLRLFQGPNMSLQVLSGIPPDKNLIGPYIGLLKSQMGRQSCLVQCHHGRIRYSSGLLCPHPGLRGRGLEGLKGADLPLSTGGDWESGSTLTAIFFLFNLILFRFFSLCHPNFSF